jgi:hypothetical protein
MGFTLVIALQISTSNNIMQNPMKTDFEANQDSLNQDLLNISKDIPHPQTICNYFLQAK